ncbi:MAG TPA: maltose alpha-D-glucosyltransferase [Candidatus Omnitrophota bacterium]|nr:maltose alpha-D-glucosyltransferase [Candidatus Omnitrophota bacterium]HPB67716.1 maltose alpha-D-glucosyltransferase [Candidatus Omnitrophota bacterium]HQO58188.1 maltose alpha-D-glucosyltransferase [Candidatus Omnitrophota bacterium]
MPLSRTYLDNDPQWYKDAVIYQLHVKTFCDGDGNGRGDFKGLTAKLDYLKNLGVTAIWLLPFYPSPLKDDGYDIADYYNIHPQYGTLKDFKEFLRQAHRRGLRVITELVVNHTSMEHPWFKRARKSPAGSRDRNYYVWSDSPDKYKDARVIFNDFESSNWAWDEEAQSYYWHRFYSHQPDLNFENPNVQKEILRVADFWFSLGVDGVRLDAVPYLFEREGTNCENLPETYAFLKKLRKHVESRHKNRMLLAEANQWPEDAVAYFGKGDECHMAFHFPLMPRMYMAVQMEDRFPIIDILEQTPRIPRDCQWAIFLRNHDELTLEMVTDEERDYMYRAFARDDRSRLNLGIRRRLVPLLMNDRKKVELMNILLFSLPGTPIIYYGDEIGMGDNHYLGDRDGVRTPMQWTPDRNAGFSKANPQQLYLPVIIDSEYHYETVNVETQEKNLSSLLWWMKRVIAMRRKYRAFSQGGIKLLYPDNHKVLVFIRHYRSERILVVINLSRFSQSLEIDLKEFSGCVPEEVFSQNVFPPIQEAPYILTLGPHNHYWLLLKKSENLLELRKHKKQKKMTLSSSWEELFDPGNFRRFENEILPSYLNTCRWFGGKALQIRSLRVMERIPLVNFSLNAQLLFLHIQYVTGEETVYFLPVMYLSAAPGETLSKDFPAGVIIPLTVRGEDGVLCDATYDKRFQAGLLQLIAQKKKVRFNKNEIRFLPGRAFSAMLGDPSHPPAPQLLKAEQSNTSVIYGNTFYLKLFRRVEGGMNPEVEMIKYLSARRFSCIPTFAGMIERTLSSGKTMTLGLLQSYTPHQGDAWQYTRDHVMRFYEKALTQKADLERVQESLKADDSSPGEAEGTLFIDTLYLQMVQRLGKCTGEMHETLSREEDNPDFTPESFSMLYQRSVYQSMGSQARSVMKLLKRTVARLPVETQREAAPVIEQEDLIYSRLRRILKTKFSAKKIRIHGDYHLGQVLFTGKDFVIIDFEGEPLRSISERRLKRSALRDVAGMLRSFHYAAYGALFLRKGVREDDPAFLEWCADFWYAHVSQIFLKSYFEALEGTQVLPRKKTERDVLLDVFLLDKAIYELAYELNNRPDWVLIPLRGIRHILARNNNRVNNRRGMH